jgi:hypothetical protein
MNGIYNGIDNGIVSGTYSSINSGIGGGLYNNDVNLNVSSIVTSGLILYLDSISRISYQYENPLIWNDLSGNLNNCTLFNGPVYDYRNGGSILFDGVNDYGEIPNNSLLNTTTGTVSIWFNYSTVTGTFGSPILGKTSITQSNNGYNIIITPQNQIYAQIKGPGNSGIAMNTISLDIVRNRWYNFVFTYTSGQNYTLYLNGIASATGSLVSFTIDATQPMRIADSVDAFWGIFGGRIYNITIYNRILRPEEITRNFLTLKTKYRT